MRYTRVDLVKSYLDAQRYSNAEKILAEDAQAFTLALQLSFGIPLADFEDVHVSNPHWPMALVFRRGVEAIRAQDDGVLEDGLLYRRLEQNGEAGQRILNQYALVGESRQQVVTHAITLLTDVMAAIWPDAPLFVTTDDLSRHGFNDSTRPDPMDFW